MTNRMSRTLRKSASQSEPTSPLNEVRLHEWYWIPHPTRVWVSVVVREINGNYVWVAAAESRDEFEVDITSTPFLPMNPRVVDDMTSLLHLHEAGILHNLSERSKPQNHHPYTYIANVLIAVNPLTALPQPPLHDYKGRNITACEPHPYGIAEMAYTQLTNKHNKTRSQSIVISGESGAGKTETAKILLRYLCWRSTEGSSTAKPLLRKGSGVGLQSFPLDQKLLDTNPILEAFGNAMTVRNPNSSRFGKLLKLQYNTQPATTLSSAAVDTYLLEKSRVSAVGIGERNYHVFYQLCSTSTLRKKYRLKEPLHYYYLAQSDVIEVDGIDDEGDYKQLTKSLTSIGMTSNEIDAVFRVLSGVLSLGNVTYLGGEEAGDGVSIAEPYVVQLVADLLNVDKENLEQLLTSRVYDTGGGGRRGSTYRINLDATQAVQVRDAMAKSVYKMVFEFVVSKINASLAPTDATSAAASEFIGVLDIFGFESFQSNSLEQLLINYANECLLLLFNNAVLVAEQQLYLEESLLSQPISFSPNTAVIDLITNPRNGLFTLLDTVCKGAGQSDAKYISLVHQEHGSGPYASYFPKPPLQHIRYCFAIKHYASTVTYSSGSLIQKNMDRIPNELAVLLSQSSYSSTGENSVCSIYNTDMQGGSRKLAPPSVTSHFTKQMSELVQLLQSTTPTFIRCIKPNSTMTVGLFDPAYVMEQVRVLGIVQTLLVLQQGLPARLSYTEVASLYKSVMTSATQHYVRHFSDQQLVMQLILPYHGVPDEAYCAGKSKIFFTTKYMHIMELLSSVTAVDAEKFNKNIISILMRRYWRHAVVAVMCQNRFIAQLARLRLFRRCAECIQHCWRVYYVSEKRHRRIKLRRMWRVNIAKIVLAQWYLQHVMLIIEARNLRLAAERAAEIQLTSHMISRRSSNGAGMSALLAASTMATVSVSLFRWMHLPLVKAFEKWLLVMSLDEEEDEFRVSEVDAETCYECTNRPGALYCSSCRVAYCSTCAAFVHNCCRVMRKHGQGVGVSHFRGSSSSSNGKKLERSSLMSRQDSNNFGELGQLYAHNESMGSDEGSEVADEVRTDRITFGISDEDLRASTMMPYRKSEYQPSTRRRGHTVAARGSMVGARVSFVGGTSRISVSGGGSSACAIKSCTNEATRGVSIRFCEEHYEEFRSAMKQQNDAAATTLQQQVLLLKKQLQMSGQQPVEFVELAVARERMQEAVERLMAGDSSAEAEIEKWDKAIRYNPEYVKEMEEKAALWDAEQLETNQACLREMRCLVPPDVLQSSVQSMIDDGLPKSIANRLWSKRVLWLLRSHPDDIKRIHIADLRSKYSNQGLDIVEMRAVYMCLPTEFDNDGDGKKSEWRSMFRSKLEELCIKENNNSLTSYEKRHAAYKGHFELVVYDPDTPLIKQEVQKSSAFEATEISVDITPGGGVAALKSKLASASAPAPPEAQRRDIDMGVTGKLNSVRTAALAAIGFKKRDVSPTPAPSKINRDDVTTSDQFSFNRTSPTPVPTSAAADTSPARKRVVQFSTLRTSPVPHQMRPNSNSPETSMEEELRYRQAISNSGDGRRNISPTVKKWVQNPFRK